MAASQDYIGKSLAKPFLITTEGKGATVTGNEAIEQAILEVLYTPLGSRMFLPEYGSRMEEILFEPNDDVLRSLARLFTKQAIQKWVKGVKYLSLDISRPDEDSLEIHLSYRVLATNKDASFVFPYYKKLQY